MTATPLHTLHFGGEVVCFSIVRTARRKTVAISVGFEGVRVLAPPDLDDARIMGILRKKGAWVLRKQMAYRELGEASPAREFVSGEAYHYLGRPYRLKVVTARGTVSTRIAARGTLLVAPVAPDWEPMTRRAAIRSALSQWYRSHAEPHFLARITAMAKRLGVKTPPIHVVDQSKRWGSCDTRGHIRFNWRLIMAPMALIEYVVAHELCHLREHNHSHRFWRSLETIMPDYEARVRRLNKLGSSMVL